MIAHRWLWCVTIVTTLVCGLVGVAPRSWALPPGHPDGLPGLTEVNQVIVVVAENQRSTSAQLRTYERGDDGRWTLVHGPVTATLGWSGLVPGERRRQGTGKTPMGTYALVDAFGRLADPGTAMPYYRFDRDDAWTYFPKVPSTYNILQTANRRWQRYGSYVEHLWSYGAQYRYVVVLDYNLPPGPITTGSDGIRRSREPADTRRGGGIFLHVSNGRRTAGCIAIPEDQMRQIMTWLDPNDDPHIVIGTARSLAQRT
jgi:L,D-peptidoglycan transpeptidase YkuD (ErfK/YbiS/YcfS/YnhG family)